MTREELKKAYMSINKHCENGFGLDLDAYLISGKKRKDLIKKIKTDDGRLLQAQLLYCYDNTISLNIDLLKPTDSGCYICISQYEDNDEIKHDKKDMKLLYNITEWLSDEVILSLAEGER